MNKEEYKAKKIAELSRLSCDLEDFVEGVANGNAFDKKTGLIWKHWIDKAKEISAEAERMRDLSTKK